MSIIFSFGSYGGFYLRWGYMKRLCLGWFAITITPFDIDDMFGRLCELDDAANGTTK